MIEFIEKHLKYFILFDEMEIEDLLPSEFEFNNFKFKKKEYKDRDTFMVEYASGHKKLSCGGSSRFTANAYMACIVMSMGAILPEKYLRKLSSKVAVSDAIEKKIFALFKQDSDVAKYIQCDNCGRCKEETPPEDVKVRMEVVSPEVIDSLWEPKYFHKKESNA